MEIQALTQPEQKYTYAQSMQLEGRRDVLDISEVILPPLDMAFILLGLIRGSNGKLMNLSRAGRSYQYPA